MCEQEAKIRLAVGFPFAYSQPLPPHFYLLLSRQETCANFVFLNEFEGCLLLSKQGAREDLILHVIRPTVFNFLFVSWIFRTFRHSPNLIS